MGWMAQFEHRSRGVAATRGAGVNLSKPAGPTPCILLPTGGITAAFSDVWNVESRALSATR